MNSKISLLVACVLLLTFVSCSEDEPNDGKQTVTKVKHVECTMKADFYDLTEIAEITITYFDETGASKSEVVKDKTWEKKFTTSTFPIKLTPTVFIKAKTDTYSKDEYKLGCDSQISYVTIFTDGKTGKGHIHGSSAISTSIKQVAALETFFRMHGNKNIALGGWILKLDSDGTTIVEE